MPLDHPCIAFPRLDDEQIGALRAFASRRTFKPGETLFAAGDVDVAVFVIERGEVGLIDRSAGRDRLVAVQGEKEFTGDVDIFTGRPAAVSAVARTGCETDRIPATRLRRIVGELPRVGELLLRAFLMRRQLLEASGFAAVRVIGSRYCRDTHRIRELLARNKIPFSWLDLESDLDVNTLLSRFGVGADEMPVVICGDGRLLRSPSNAELAASLGIRKPLERTVYDLAIVGAGPAGLAAGVYGASEGLKTLIVDCAAPGGQAAQSSLIENYMGFPAGLSGADLANRALVQAHKFGAIFSAPMEVTGLRCGPGYHILRIHAGEDAAAKCILICTGAAYRKLDAVDCARFESFGLYYAATAVEAQLCRRAQVVVVGGGNSAGQAAVYLAEYASRVLLLMRGDDLRKDMSDYLARRVERTRNIEVRRQTEIVRMNGDKWLSAVDLRARSGESERLHCVAVFVFIGAVPHTDWLSGAIGLDRKGFIRTGQDLAGDGAWRLGRRPFMLETACPGIFAAGDVRSGSIKRVASAVGEGSMAVRFAHEYLAAC